MRSVYFLLSGLVLLLAGARADSSASLERAIALYRQGEFRQAVAALETERQAAPDQVEVRLWLGKALLKVQKWNEAVTELERAVALEPSSSRCHLYLGRALGEKASHASKLSAFGIARKVRDEFEAAVRLDPNNLEARFDLLQYYIEAPGIVGGGKDKARAQAEEIAARNPMRGCSARAQILRDEKKWAPARAEYERACKEFPMRPEPHLEKAEYLLDQGEPQAALASAERALALAPQSAQARLLTAAGRIRSGAGLEEAERSLKALARGPLDDADPTFAEVYYWLGQLYVAQRNSAAARDALQKALAYEPEHALAKKGLSELRP